MPLVSSDHPALHKPSPIMTLEQIQQAALPSEALLIEMRAYLRAQPRAAAISAPQFGHNLRFFILSGSGQLVFNPSIERHSGRILCDNEECMTIHGYVAKILRHEFIHVRYETATGTVRYQKFSGWLARLWQHEIDHLDGICIWDENHNMRVK